jgi:two-component system OmpR family response regulator
VERFRPQVMVLDVMLPDMEGFEVAERLGAQRGHVPIIFLTARDATEDKLRGLSIGGDDYVTKPFSLEELVARIRVILRRTGAGGMDDSRLRFEDLELDEDTREVTRAGRPVELTATEYRLLHYLMLNPRRVLTRSQILDHVWEYDFGGDARVLETYISYLRKKLDRHGPSLIHTARGVGYALRPPRR